MSEPSDIQAAGQHYLVCGTEDCMKNAQFYCNVCHRPMCEQCRNEHLNSPNTITHEIVLYKHRKHQLPVEKCKLHPTRNVDIFCKECKIPLCVKCFTTIEHKNHEIDDLEEIYSKKYAFWQSEFSKIQRYFRPTLQGLKADIKEDATKIKKIMKSIRTSMKSEADSLRNLVDEVISENIERTYTEENKLLKLLNSEEDVFDEYNEYLGRMTDQFEMQLSLTIHKLLLSETIEMHSIPETLRPVAPVFSQGHFTKEKVADLLGRVSVPNKEPERRKIKPMKTVSSCINLKETKMGSTKEKSSMKQKMYPSSFVTEVNEYKVSGVHNVFHVSVDNSKSFWASDDDGNLVQTDPQGNQLQKILTSGRFEGYHTVTKDGDMIYSEKANRVIKRITSDNTITEFFKTGDWTPHSLHSSRGDILVGMIKDKEAKITRYTMSGHEIQNIQRDSERQELYKDPKFITKNMNGDICASDSDKRAVVVVNNEGHRRFSYEGQTSEFRPWGICTDVNGHILVCTSNSTGEASNVHLLDCNGQFLTILLSEYPCVKYPRSVCVDDHKKLYVGQSGTNILKVYKYLQKNEL